jgi:NAD(P)-dependent dehydrogenase (short-subunit alcohol dehydrogenase family)
MNMDDRTCSLSSLLQDLEGKMMTEKPIALITGGAQGIGLACAQALSEDGHRIVLVDINQDGVRDAAAQIDGAVGIGCDMGDADAVLALFDQVETDHGPVSVLVNNAGVAMPGDFLDYDLETFDTVLGINLRGVFVATQRAAKTMVAQGIEGAIVNMSSINAQLAIPTIPAYCASKGGMMQLTKVAALALAPHNIRVNAVGPGSIDTAMMAAVNANPDAYKTAMSRTPLGRPGTAREIADTVAFLASSKASYITGETIYVDGGRLGLNYTM